MVFKKQDNLQKIRYEIIRERIVRNRIIDKIVWGFIGTLIGSVFLIFDIGYLVFVYHISQYVYVPVWFSMLSIVLIFVLLVIGTTLFIAGIEIWAMAAKLIRKYKKDYGIEAV